MADCSEFFRLTGRRVTFEYTLMAGVNDSPVLVRPASQRSEMSHAGQCKGHVKLSSMSAWLSSGPACT